MCLNCGCGMPDDTMGDERNVTLTDLAEGAIASNQDGKTTLENMKSAIKQLSAEDIDQKIEEVKKRDNM